MRKPRYTRQLLLFLLAVLLPAATLVGLGAYIVRQNAELTARRATDERARTAEQATRELTARLREIAVRETSRSLPDWSAAPSRDPAVLYSAPVNSMRSPVVWQAPSRYAGGGRDQWERQTLEQLEALAQALPTIRSQVDSASSSTPGSAAWLAYGPEPWLVTITRPATPVPALLVVVSAPLVAPPGTVLIAGTTPTSFPVAPPYLNLSLEVLPGPLAATSPRGSAPMLIGLILILGIVGFAGYLLIRDVGREIGTAALRTQFVTNVSHELKTPLTAIRLFADKLVASSGSGDQARARYADTIINECDRLSRLVDNVLEFARIDSGTKTYRFAPGSIAEVVASSVQAVEYMLEQKGFDLTVDIESDLPTLKIDTHAMEQVVLNLLTNAAKFSGDSREIRLTAKRNGSDVVVAVSDRGVGVDPSDLDRIFERFYRADNGESGHVAGAGLGLALAKHIVEAHGGHIDARSDPGTGSTFAIHLPIPPRSTSEVA